MYLYVGGVWCDGVSYVACGCYVSILITNFKSIPHIWFPKSSNKYNTHVKCIRILVISTFSCVTLAILSFLSTSPNMFARRTFAVGMPNNIDCQSIVYLPFYSFPRCPRFHQEGCWYVFPPFFSFDTDVSGWNYILIKSTSAARSFHTAANAETMAKKYLTLGGATLLTAAGLYTYQSHSVAAAEKAAPLHGAAGTNSERTFIAIKPDGVQRGLISEVIARYFYLPICTNNVGKQCLHHLLSTEHQLMFLG